MPPIVLAMIAVAALMHAAWNVLIKTSGDPLLVAERGMIAATIVGLPVAVVGWLVIGSPAIPAEAWGLGVLSGLLEVVYFVLLLWGLSRPSVLAAVPRGVRRIVLFLGDISYSLYLVHYPLLVVIGAGWIAMAGQKPINVMWPLLASLVPIPFAYVLWRLIERPSQALGRALARPAARDRDRAVTSGSAP